MSNITNKFSKHGVVRAVVSVADSVHDGRTFVRSENAYNIRFLNSPVANGNMNCYGANFKQEAKVVNYHDDDTMAEMFYIWAEVSNDLEFLIQPQSGDSFVNVRGGMIENAELMLYERHGDRYGDNNTLKLDPNELFYHDIEDGSYKIFIRSTPINSGKSAGYISAGKEAEPLITRAHKETEICYITSKGQYYNIPCNLGKIKSDFIIPIDQIGNFEFARCTETYRLVSVNDFKNNVAQIKQSLEDSGAVSTKKLDKSPEFIIYKDNFARILIANTNGLYWDGTQFGKVNKNCLFTYDGNDNKLYRFIDDVMIMEKCFFTRTKALTLDKSQTFKLTDLIFKDMSKKKREDLGKTDGDTITSATDLNTAKAWSERNMDMNTIDSSIAFNSTPEVVNKQDLSDFYRHEDRIIPEAKYIKYVFNDKEIYVFDWLSWIELLNKDDYPFLYMFKDIIETSYATNSSEMYDMKFKVEAAPESKVGSDENRAYASSFGWNRYRNDFLAGELADVRNKINLLIQEVISMDSNYNFNKEINMSRIESIVKQLFVSADGTKLKRHNLASLTFFKLCELFKVDKQKLLETIPSTSITTEYVLPFYGACPFQTEKDKEVTYTTNDSAAEALGGIAEKTNPYIIVTGEGRRAINVVDNACEILKLNCNKYVEDEFTYGLPDNGVPIDYQFKSVLPKIGIREHGYSVKRNPAGQSKTFAVKLMVEFARIYTAGKYPYRDFLSNCSDDGPDGEHCWFKVPSRIKVDRQKSTLPKDLSYIYDKVDKAFEDRYIELVWFKGYGGSRDSVFVNLFGALGGTHRVNGVEIEDRHIKASNFCFGDGFLDTCDCKDRTVTKLYINYANGIKVLKDELATSEVINKYGEFTVLDTSDDLQTRHAITTNLADGATLKSMRNYHHNNQGSEFTVENIFTWCRVNNWGNCLGKDNQQYLCEKIISLWSNIGDRTSDIFEVKVNFIDTNIKDYCTKDAQITETILNSKTVPEIESEYVNVNPPRICNGIFPEQKDYNKDCIKCKTRQSVTLRMFDDRFDKVMLNSLTQTNAISSIANKLTTEITKLMINHNEIKERVMYANIAYNLLPNLANRFTIENPIYPPCAIIDYSLLKERGLYEVPDELVKVEKDHVKFGEPQTNLESIFKKISEQLTESAKVLNEQSIILIKMKTGCGHVRNLFEKPDDSFIDLKVITNEQLSEEIQDNNYCYLVFKEQSTVKEDHENASDKLLQVGGLKLKVLRKTDDTIEFNYKTYILYYNRMYGLGSNVNESEADVEINVGEIKDEKNNFTGVRYDYRLAPHSETVISWLRKFQM